MPAHPHLHVPEREVRTTTIVDPVMRLSTVLRLTGLSKSQLYREMQASRFPRPVQLTENTVGWRQSAVVEWIDTRPGSAA